MNKTYYLGLKNYLSKILKIFEKNISTIGTGYYYIKKHYSYLFSFKNILSKQD